MQGYRCMKLHKNKITNKSKRGIFLGRYNRHHQQGISPRDPRSGRGKDLVKLSDLHRVDLVDTTNKNVFLDTTNKGLFHILTMMNSRRTDLLG
jgi:hypothetical protein